ncbi:MAG: nuclear transport factor 2 family protein [Aquamicrobium sp.]|uniref:YybH family protein n=1 Tax=Aquamicrobium sp. TaxID=1872579 RepID=UPI00349E5230|nr:nuclear transport factor 2 family protein [Aquamicrobium sp.]MCO5158242.1 nuclear transport factor 2 family protein [Aquamicrobium sp.]
MTKYLQTRAIRGWSAILALAVALATSLPAFAQSGVASPRDAAEVFATATAAGDAETIAALYASDAIMLAPGAAPIVGRDAIKAVFVRNFSHGRNRMAFGTIRVESGADRAAAYWEWASEITGKSGAVQKTNGRSLVYFRKDGDIWLISADMMHVAPAQ